MTNSSHNSCTTTSTMVKGLWPLLLIGKVFGIIPLSKRFQKENNRHTSEPLVELQFSLYSLSTLYCSIQWINFMVIFIFELMGLFKTLSQTLDNDFVENILDLIYHIHITVTVTLCISSAKKFPDLFRQWANLEIELKCLEDFCARSKEFSRSEREQEAKPFYKLDAMKKMRSKGQTDADFDFDSEYLQIPREPDGKKRDFQTQVFSILNCWALTTGYLILTLIGAFSYFISTGLREDLASWQAYLDTIGEIYVIEELCEWWTGYYALFFGTLMEIAWNYGDMLIVIFSYFIYCQYSRFNRALTHIKQLNYLHSDRRIEDMRTLHWDLAKLIKVTDEILGSIIGAAFVCNILYLFTRVYLGIEEDLSNPNPFIVFEALFSFAYLIIRIFVSALMATKLNEESKKTVTILVDFSCERRGETYYLLMDRFLSQALSANIGFSGKKYFFVNQTFISTIHELLLVNEKFLLSEFQNFRTEPQNCRISR